jgi:probable rRNA maturation factor
MRFTRAALTQDASITLRIVNAEEGRALNHAYRGKDYATNVLSFVYDTEPIVCGDLVLCAPVISDEAAAQGKSIIAHYAHLVVHGVLHLHGLDHQTDAEATHMEARETTILSQLGFADPYLDLEPR